MRLLRNSLSVSPCLLFVFFLITTAAYAVDEGRHQSSASVSSERANAPQSQASSAQPAANRYGELPLSFEANQGQTNGQVRFLSRGSGYSFYLTQTGAVLTFSPDAQAGGAAFQMQLAGANANARIHGLDTLPGKSNYFFGSDSRRWLVGVPTYSKVAYENIYPGINLVYYGNQRQLEYDFVVAPGADPRQIRLAISGAEHMAIDAQGNLVLHNASGDVQLLAPQVYQRIHGRRQQISGQWNLSANHVAAFRLGAYDHTQPLVIDPALTYSSFLGGTQQNGLNKIVVDAAGNAYVAGYTTSGDFPAAPTPQVMTFGGGTASRGAFVAKIDPTGANLLYSTYLSGSANNEEATGLAVDSSGDVYVTGTTHSADFPTSNALQSTCPTHNQAGTCASAFLTKISSTGNALVFSTYLGGSAGESARSLAVDSTGSAYVLGVTSSLDFPVTAGAAQAKCAGTCQQNAFLAKFNPNGDSLAYATYLGGSGADNAADVAVDALGNAYVAGHTTSADFPLVTPFQKACTADATSTTGACVDSTFVTKVKADGSAFVYSTYLSGSLGSQAAAIAVDSAGSAYVTGSTQSADFPVAKPYQKSCALDKVSGTCSVDAFVTKLAPSGSTLAYSTYLGGTGSDQASGIVLDSAGNAYVVGSTQSADLPMKSALQSKLKGTSDAFIARLDSSGSSLTFSTYHGGSATEAGSALTVDAKGNVYVTGATTSTDFPTQNAFQSSCAGTCASAFVSKLAAPATDPTFTSLNNTTFTVKTAGSFAVTATGTLPIVMSESGTMDNNGVVTFTPNASNNGDATIAGTPTTGDGGTYTFTLTAAGVSTVTQTFTLTINEAAATPTGPGTMTCTVGTACTANSYSATGFPAPTLSATGTLPNGVTFTPGSGGTGSLGGTPAQCSGKVYHGIAIQAVNGIGTNPTSLSVDPVTIDEAPTFSSANSTEFAVGALGTFNVTACAYPAATFSVTTGTLPSGVNLSSAGVLSGTPTAGTAGQYPITITASNASGNVTQSFTLNVVGPPSLGLGFGASSIQLGATTNLTFTMTNPAANTVDLTGVGFTDTLPTGLTVVSASSTQCSGTLTTTSPTGISLSGATIPVGTGGNPGTCVFSVTVTGATAGDYSNSVSSITSGNGGNGGASNTANLTVVAPPTIQKSFSPTSVEVNVSTSTSTLTLTIANPPVNTTATEDSVAVSDPLPAGMAIASPDNLTNTCGGTATDTGGVLKLTGGTILANKNCTVSVSVVGTTAGTITNTTQTVSSSNGGTGLTAQATLDVVSISVSPTSATLEVNNTLNFTATVVPSQSVSWTLTGANCSGSACGMVSPASTGSGVATTYTAPSTAPLGTITLTATTSAGFTKTATITVTDFTVSVSPTSSPDISPGSNTTTTLTLAAFNANGYGGTVTPSCSSGLPSGWTCTFAPTTITGSGTSTLTVQTTSGTAGGAYPITVTGQDAATVKVSHSTTFTVNLVTLSVSPTSTTVEVNNTQTLDATVNPPRTITWSLFGTGCSGTTCGGVSPTTGTSTTYTAPSAVPSSTVTATASAAGGRTGVSTITVSDYSLAIGSTSQDVLAGNSATTTLTATAINGYTGTIITPSCTGLPTGASCSFSPATMSLPATPSTTVTISTSGTTPTGPFSITLSGKDNATVAQTRNASSTFSLTVVTITLSVATAKVEVNNTQQVTATVSGLTNTAVTWAAPSGSGCSGAGCGGVTATTPTTTYTAPATAPSGTVSVSAIASDGLVSPQPAAITVTDYSLGVSSNPDVAPTSSVTTTVTASAINGYTGTITPTCSGLPAGATCGFNPATLTVSGSPSSTITVTTTGVAPGIYTITVSGTDGAAVAVTHTTTFTLHVVVVTISTTPPTTLEVNQTIPFSGSTAGLTDTTVNWSTVGSNCAGSACGTISAAGPNTSTNYTSPGSTQSGVGVAIKATSNGDSGFSQTTSSFLITDYSVSLNSTQLGITQSNPGATASSTLTAQWINGYAGTVNTPQCVISTTTAATSAPTCSASAPSVSGTSSTSPVSITTQPDTSVGFYSMQATATDQAATPQTRSTNAQPIAVQCALSLGQVVPTFTPAQSGGANQYSIGVSVATVGGVAQGGSACPYGDSGVVGVSAQPSPVASDGAVVTSILTGTNGVASTTQSGAVNFQVAAAGPVVQNAAKGISVSYFDATQAATNQTTLTFPVTVEANNSLSAGVGATSLNLVVTQTGTLNVPNIGTSSSVCGVLNAAGASDPNDFGITCTAAQQGGTWALTVNVSATTPTASARNENLSPMMLFALGLPAIVFLGTGFSAFGPRRKRRMLQRMTGIFLMLLVLVLLPSCGGGFHATFGGTGTSATYTVTVMGYETDSSNNVQGVEVFTVPLTIVK